MSFADIEQENVLPDDAFPTRFDTQAHVGHQGQTPIQADWQGQFQQDTYAQAPFQEQLGSLAESQFYYVEYRSGYAMTGQDQVDNAAQARMAGLGQIYRPGQARRPGSGRTVDQHYRLPQQVPQIYGETPQDRGFLHPNSVEASHNSQHMMQPGNHPQETSYQSAEFSQPNRGLHQPRDAGNLDGATSSQDQEFTQPKFSSSDLEASSSGSASGNRHLQISNSSNARLPPSAATPQAKRGRRKRRRQQTPEPPGSEGSGSTVDSSGDGDWRDSAPSNKRQRLESKPSTTKASTIKQTKRRDVKRTSNVVRQEFQQSNPHASLHDTDGNAVFSAVFGVYELAGEQGYCERNQAPEIYRRNNMRALRCHYTLESTSSTTDGLLWVADPTTGKKHRVTSMTFRISGVTSENEREDLPILESDNKRSKWTPTAPKPNVLPHIPSTSDDAVANGATSFHKSVGVGNDDPKSTHYEWSHLQFQAGTKHNGVRRTTQMFQFMRLSLIAEWGKGERDRTKVASCAGQRYIVFARSPGGRKALTKDDKEGSEAMKKKGNSRRPQRSTASPDPEQELGRAHRKRNSRGIKVGKHKRQRRYESTPQPTPKVEPESDSEPLIGRMRRRAAQAGRTPRDILHLPSTIQGQESPAAIGLKEEDQQSQKAEDPRADTSAAHVSPDRAEQELVSGSLPFGSPTEFADSSPFGSPEPGWRLQLGRHIDAADEADGAAESEAPILTEGPTAPYGTTVNTPSFFDEDARWDEFDREAEEMAEVKEHPDEKVHVEQESPKAPAQLRAAESDLLAGVGDNLSRVLRSSPMLPPRTSDMAGIRPPTSTQSPLRPSMLASPRLAGWSARQYRPPTFTPNIFRVPSSWSDPSWYGLIPSGVPHVPNHDNPDPLAAAIGIGRAGSTAYDWQHAPPTVTATINPSVLRNEAAVPDHDPWLGVEEDEMREDVRKAFWSRQL